MCGSELAFDYVCFINTVSKIEEYILKWKCVCVWSVASPESRGSTSFFFISADWRGACHLFLALCIFSSSVHLLNTTTVTLPSYSPHAPSDQGLLPHQHSHLISRHPSAASGSVLWLHTSSPSSFSLLFYLFFHLSLYVLLFSVCTILFSKCSFFSSPDYLHFLWNLLLLFLLINFSGLFVHIFFPSLFHCL